MTPRNERPFSDEQVEASLVESCERSAVPVVIKDRAVLRRIATLAKPARDRAAREAS